MAEVSLLDELDAMNCWCGRDGDVCEENGGCRWSATMSAAEARTAAAELKVTLLRSVLLEGGQDDATARRRALAITGTGAESAPLTAAEAGRIARMVTGHENAVAAVRAGLDLAAPFAGTDPAVIAAAREALRVLSGEEGAGRG